MPNNVYHKKMQDFNKQYTKGTYKNIIICLE